MIVTVTLNPSLDDYITVHGLRVGESNRWAGLHRYAGGKGIDVSRAIHEMGGVAMAYGFIGGQIGRLVEILLDEEGVPFSFTPVTGETRINFIIADTKISRQTIINAPGPRIAKRELERFRKKLEEISPRPDLVVMSGSVPPGIPTTIYYDLIMQFKGIGVRTILDTAGAWLEEGIKAKPYLIKPNVRETEDLLKIELPSEKAITEAALKLVDMGIEVAVISRGKDGIIVASKKSIIKIVPPELKVRSAVGAGDCAVAGFALKISENEPLIEASRLAAAMGSATVLTPGTELCHREDVERILPQLEVWEISARQGSKTFPAAKS